MDFSFHHQQVRMIKGRQTVRIPKEFSLDSDLVFIYRNGVGHGIAVVPVDSYGAKDWRQAAMWGVENGYDSPPVDMGGQS